ncbi:DUF3606 domain-containing protein [Variovorax sp. J22P168]|uniref:DUF3606 domain-containing protein n=1 Tax=Variovorax jilinensis TaxID=3053513 RepID=UPI002576A447|nr:DUF3606 domain-containing protein [Variovorax sp. J22P168]MDM0015441.1 DUF3606 domain-containing protein [Variovorax sp. J22P168]
MTDETIDIPPDERRVDVTQLHEVRSWMLAFGCSEVELRLAVRDVGDRAEDVRVHLNQRK